MPLCPALALLDPEYTTTCSDSLFRSIVAFWLQRLGAAIS